MDFVFHDGGRVAAGYKGSTGDCVTRAIAIATGKPYQEVYDALNRLAQAERLGKRKRRRSSSRTGVFRATYQRYLESLGWRWTSTMSIGSGCQVHLRASELPAGPLLVKVSRHLTAVIDCVLYDTHNCSRGGTRCVYGFFSLKPLSATPSSGDDRPRSSRLHPKLIGPCGGASRPGGSSPSAPHNAGPTRSYGDSFMLLTMQSKTAATHKLEQLIVQGRSRAGEVVDHVMNNQPSDRLARGGELSFTPDAELNAVRIEYPDSNAGTLAQRLHRHSVQQMAQTTDLPLKFIDSLQQTTEPWARELLAHNLKTVFTNRFAKSRYLLRSVNGEVRGFLSDRYRRLDSRPIIEAFATAVQQKGALPYDGYVTDTKVALQAIMPEVYEPIPGEMVAYGLSLENSDFGNGALSVRAYLLRIWCSNLAITQEEMRQVHLGKRLDDSVLYSQRTYELDAETTVSALRDVIGAQLNADALRRRMDSVRLAHERRVDAGSARDLLRKTLLKAESDAVIEAYNSPDTQNLPAGNTTWRLSNAISWVAGNTGDPERKLELMKFAGEVLPAAG